jgi:glucokinase
MEKEKYYIGAGLNLFDGRALLVRRDGKIMMEVKNCAGAANVNDTIKILLELIGEIAAKTSKHKEAVAGIGVALGGIVNSPKGVVYWPQKKADSCVYAAMPLGGYLEKKFGFPVTICNDASACAWAEHTCVFPKSKNLIYLFSGLGAGIVADGRLYAGKTGKAGELFITPQKAMSSTLGDFSFLKPWPADLNMVSRAKQMISLGEDSGLLNKITSTGELKTKDIFDELKKKDKVARKVVREAAFALGVKAAFLVNLLNPETLVLGGGLEDAPEAFFEDFCAAVKGFSFSETVSDAKIAVSSLGPRAAAMGAALLAGLVE